MAIRPVFEADNEKYVKVENYEFTWYSGFSKLQKQKSFKDLHSKYLEKNKTKSILEVSTSSDKSLGVKLSAFNLMIKDKLGKEICSIESLFQSCKKFEKGGPYKDIIYKSPIEAKRDIRLKESGNLICFYYKNEEWELEPKTQFYDWIYINTLHQHIDLREEILKYDAFTDIAFNPQKSINCQARSAALYVGLYRKNILNKVLKSKEEYLEFVYEKEKEQLKLNLE